MSRSTERLPRLLALVPYLLAHPGALIDDVAREFGVSAGQLRDDLNLIFVCGLPGHSPGDLMEVDIFDERITLTNADVLARPLRLSAEEGLALVVALRTMVGLPDVADPVLRALTKLEEAVAPITDTGVQVVVEEEKVLQTVSGALHAGRRLHLSYYVPGRDEVTERDVDPIEVHSVDGRYYLEGYCRLAADLRVFRLDRVRAAEVLEVAGEVPDDVVPRDFSAGVYQPGPTDLRVRLRLAPAGRWVADYYPCESVREAGGGELEVTLRTADTGWLVRLMLGLGGAGRVLEPAGLGEQVRAAAAAALANYA